MNPPGIWIAVHPMPSWIYSKNSTRMAKPSCWSPTNRRSPSMHGARSSCAMEKFWKTVMNSFRNMGYLLSTLLLVPTAIQAQDQDLLFTGEVFSQQAQEVF